MKTATSVCLAAAVLLLAQPPIAAQTAKFRFLAAVYADDKGAGLNRPEGVACGPAGRFVVADTGNDRLLRFTYQDKLISGGSPVQAPQIAAPARAMLNSKGDIYVLNNKERRIVQLSPEGEFRQALAFDGAPPPATVVPTSFGIDGSDNIYVADVFSRRVLAVTAQGKFARAVPFPDDAAFVSQLAVDDAGTVLLLDAVKRRLFSAAKDATAFAPLGGDLSEGIATLPTFLAISKGTVFVLEGIGGRIVSLRRDGTFIARQLTAGREEGMLDHPVQMCINDKDEVFIADRDNSRIQIFQLIR